MNDQNTERPDRMIDRIIQNQSSRRLFLRRALALGLSAPVVGGLLAACGGDDDDDDDDDSGGEPTSADAGGDEPTATAEDSSGEDEPTEAEGDSGDEPTATSEDSGGDTGGGEGQAGGTLNFGLLRDAIGFDPHIAYGASSSSLQGNVYDTVITYDLEGNLAGGLAETWEVSDDGLEYTLSMRQGVTFHEGQAFSAEDVVANLDRILDETNGLARRTELSNIGSYEASDEQTLVLSLEQPYATLLAVLATNEVGIASKEWLESGVDPAREMNGTGPFMLDSFEPEVRYTLVKNPNYWQSGLPYLDTINETPIPDDNARVNALLSGEINFVEYVPWQNMAEIDDNSDFQLFKGFDLYNIVRLNTNRPPLDNKLVRQALNYAIDREAVIAVAFGGEGLPMTNGLFPPGSPWYNEELEGHWTYDPEKAMSLLEEAGVDPTEVTLDFTVATISVHSDTAQVVQQQLEQLGFTINYIQQDVPSLTERRTTGDYQMMQDGLSLNYPDPDYYSVYFAIGGTAHAAGIGYENEELTEILERGRSETDPEVRKEIYLEFERALMEEAPWIFVLHRPQAEAMAASVKGYTRIPGLGLRSEAFLENLYIEE
ncbi:MAG: ABC transporter substrate-binding protein [Thermomicrobiales bacterium]